MVASFPGLLPPPCAMRAQFNAGVEKRREKASLAWPHPPAQKAEGLVASLTSICSAGMYDVFEMVMNNIILTALHKRARVHVHQCMGVAT